MADAADIFDDTGDAGWADDAAAEEEVEAEEEAELTEDEFAEDEDAGAGYVATTSNYPQPTSCCVLL